MGKSAVYLTWVLLYLGQGLLYPQRLAFHGAKNKMFAALRDLAGYQGRCPRYIVLAPINHLPNIFVAP